MFVKQQTLGKEISLFHGSRKCLDLGLLPSPGPCWPAKLISVIWSCATWEGPGSPLPWSIHPHVGHSGPVGLLKPWPVPHLASGPPVAFITFWFTTQLLSEPPAGLYDLLGQTCVPWVWVQPSLWAPCVSKFTLRLVSGGQPGNLFPGS